MPVNTPLPYSGDTTPMYIISASVLQLENAELPMEVTESGIATEVRDVQEENA